MVPTTLDVAMLGWLRREMESVKRGFNNVHDFEVTHAAPQRPQNGWVRYADGVDWNPGAGEGLYCREAGIWRKM